MNLPSCFITILNKLILQFTNWRMSLPSCALTINTNKSSAQVEVWTYQAIPQVKPVEGVAGVLVVRDLVLAHKADGSHQCGEGSPEKKKKSQNLNKTEVVDPITLLNFLVNFNIVKNMNLPFLTVSTYLILFYEFNYRRLLGYYLWLA